MVIGEGEMSKREKLIAKLRNNPNNVSFETLQKLLLNDGFEIRQPRKGSSHYHFKKGEKNISIPKHKPVKMIYTKMVLRLLGE